MKPIYRNSILAGLAGILIIAALYLLSAYLAHWEWEEHMRTSPGSGVLMVGVYSWILFVLDVPVAFAAIGAISAWASRRHITSVRETILASAVAALVPIVPATILVLALAAKAFSDTPEYHSTYFFNSLFPLIIIYLVYAFIGLMLSIAGGISYARLAKVLVKVKTGGKGQT